MKIKNINIIHKAQKFKKIVIKLGSGILTDIDNYGRLNLPQLIKISSVVAELNKANIQCVIVTSGAVAAGMSTLSLTKRPTDLTTLQACAAIGQSKLMQSYENFFKIYDLSVAQILLTHEDLKAQKSRKMVKGTLDFLLKSKNIIPIINENDPIAHDELKMGDNDILSVKTSELLNVDLLIFLTSEDGLLDFNSGKKKLIKEVKDINKVLQFAKPNERGKLSVGGMHNKLVAINKLIEYKIPAIIANGKYPERIIEPVINENIKNLEGTYFYT